MINCNFNNKDKNSSATGIKKTQKDSKKKNSEKTKIIKEIEKVDSIDHEKKIILDDKNAIPFFFVIKPSPYILLFVIFNILKVLLL